MTQADVSEVLTAAGYPIKGRRLVAWRQRGTLPKLARVGPVKGHGPRAAYGWNDEVLTQAFSLEATLRLRRRVDMAQVLTWLAGYEYPIEVMKDLWAAVEERPWENTLRRAVRDSPDQPFLLSDALVVIGIDAKLDGRRRKLSDASIDVLTRLRADPNFDAASISDRDAEQIRRDLPKLIKPMGSLALLLTADDTKRFLGFIQRYWSRPKLVALIRDLPAEMLAQAHRDMRFMLRPYRMWLAEDLGEAQRTGDPNQLALVIGPGLAPQLGRFLLLANIQMRWWGYGPHIDQTISYAAQWVEDNLQVLRQIKRDFDEIALMGASDMLAMQREWARRAQSSEDDKLQAAYRTLFEELSLVWGTALNGLLEKIESAFNQRREIVSASPELAAKFASMFGSGSLVGQSPLLNLDEVLAALAALSKTGMDLGPKEEPAPGTGNGLAPRTGRRGSLTHQLPP